MYKVKTKNYAKLLKDCYDARIPLMAYGGPGIGKSEIPRQVFKKEAERLNREFVEWSDTTLAEKEEMIKNAGKYFVFCDQRISQMDSTDLRGIPNMTNSDILETMPMSWVILFSQEDAGGIIFFDEINLAAPVVAGAAYQIINDRVCADRRIADGVYLMAAGNRHGEDKAFTFDMPFPLRDRFAEVEVGPDCEAWTEWAAGNVNPHLIAFVNWKESYLYNTKADSADKASTPRGIVRASKLLDGLDLSSEADAVAANMKVSIAVGEAFAREFEGYCKHFQSLDWTKLYKKPEMLQDFSADKLYAVGGGLAEHFTKEIESGSDKKKLIKKFDDITSLVLNMPSDFAVVTLRMLKDTNDASFRKCIKDSDNFDDLVEAYGKFIIS
jgi:hypothetical protein